LEPPDRLAELFAFGRPADGQVEHTATATDTGGGDAEPAGSQPFVHEIETVPLLAEALSRRDAAVDEGELALVVSAMGHARRAAGDLETGSIPVNEERRDEVARSPRRLLGAGCGEEDDEISGVRMADEVLGAVDDVVVAITYRTCVHRAHIRSSARFGHRQAVVALTADRGQQVAFTLLALTGFEDVARPGDEHLQSEARLAELAFGQCETDGVEPAASEFLGH